MRVLRRLSPRPGGSCMMAPGRRSKQGVRRRTATRRAGGRVFAPGAAGRLVGAMTSGAAGGLRRAVTGGAAGGAPPRPLWNVRLDADRRAALVNSAHRPGKAAVILAAATRSPPVRAFLRPDGRRGRGAPPRPLWNVRLDAGNGPPLVSLGLCPGTAAVILAAATRSPPVRAFLPGRATRPGGSAAAAVEPAAVPRGRYAEPARPRAWRKTASAGRHPSPAPARRPPARSRACRTPLAAGTVRPAAEVAGAALTGYHAGRDRPACGGSRE